jgi:uridine phosphorylase
MAQSLTSLTLVQQLSAKVGSATGIQSSIPVGGTDAIITGAGQGAAGASYDAAGVAIPSLTTIVAIYYEIPATNSSNITATGSNTFYGTIQLSSSGSTQRSALLVPQATTIGAHVDFSCSGAATLDVVYLAKD